MSVRYLYKVIPRSKRLCGYYRCKRPILRTIAKDEEGRIFHYGCLLSAREERYRCLNCHMAFDGREVALDYQFGELTVICPGCGSSSLRRLKRWPA